MGEPITLVWECLVDAVIEVFVVRKDDMTANIVKLSSSCQECLACVA